MKENLLSFKFAALAVLAGVVLAFAPASRAATQPVRPLARLLPDAHTASGESVLHGTLVDEHGRTALSSIDLKWDAPAGIGELNEAAVDASGQVASRAADLERKADGSIVARGTMTDYTGHSVNFTETLRRTTKGLVAHGAITGLPGDASSYEATTELVGRNQLRRITVFTKADGSTATRTETFTLRTS